MNLIIKGLGFTGSGALIDYLLEFNEIVQIPGGFPRVDPGGYLKVGEFNLFRQHGGILDTITADFPSDLNKIAKQLFSLGILVRELVRYSVKKRSLPGSNFFLTSIKLSKIKKLTILLALDLQSASNLNYKTNRVIQYINEVNNLFKKNKDFFLYDQSVILGKNDELWKEIFTPYKLIIVIRDVRDAISEQILIRDNLANNFSTSDGYTYGFTIKGYIQYMVDHYEMLLKKIENDYSRDRNILIISFEDLVMNSKKTKNLIRDFIGIEKEAFEGIEKRFDSDYSKKNIGIFKDKKDFWDYDLRGFKEINRIYNLFSDYKIE